jgi:hypothetical protein
VRFRGSRFAMQSIRIVGLTASLGLIAGLALLPAQASFAKTAGPIAALSTTSTSTSTSVVSPVLLPPPLEATRVSRSVISGRTTKLIISGTGFYGRPRVLTGTACITALVIRDTGTSLTVRVAAKLTSRRGTHLFTIVLLNGKKTRIHFQVN